MSFGIPVRNGPSLGLLSTAALAPQFPFFELISPGAISPLLALSRAQAAGAVSTGDTVADWQTFSANTPRYVVPDNGLLIENQRTNTFPNPRLEGGTPGTPGTQPTDIQAWVTVAGVTVEYVQNVTAEGLYGVRYRISGTASGSGTLTMVMAPTNAGYPASSGQNWTGSVFAALSAGSLTNVSNVRLVTSARVGTGVAAQTITTMSTTLSSAIQRYQSTVLNAPATTTGAMHTITVAVTAGVIDLTLDLFRPQLEQSAYASTPVLPPAGTPGASTRGTDLVSVPLTSLGIGPDGVCTILWSGVLYNQQYVGAPSLERQYILNLNNNTTTKEIIVANMFTNGVNVTHSAGSFGGAMGTYTPGVPFRVGMSFDGAGRAVASLNGLAAAETTGIAAGPYTHLNIGAQTSSQRAMFGAVTRCATLPFVMSGSELQAAVAAFPSP